MESKLRNGQSVLPTVSQSVLEEPLASLKRNERCVEPNRILYINLVLFLCESTTDRSFSRATLLGTQSGAG